MRQLLGEEELQNYLACFDAPRTYGLRVNTGKISVEEFLKRTSFHLTPVPWVENGFYYDPEEAVTKHPDYYAGLYYIQEPSAMVPASRLPVEEGDRVLDLCAAPGGKSTELAARLHGTGLLVSNDISRSRAQGLLKNLELFGAGNILVTSETPETLAGSFDGFFDKILVDAPCSGEGMFRKDRDMVKSWLEHGPEYYAPIQQEILRQAVRMLRPGGMLLYSTCTFSPLENEDNLKRLLEAEPELEIVPLSTGDWFREGQLPGTIRIWPQDVRGEGHFTALLRKKGTACEESGKDRRRTAVLPEGLSDFASLFRRPLLTKGTLDLRKENVYLLPEGFPEVRGLRFLRTGLYVGELKKKRFEPSQALAMYLKQGDFKQELNLPAGDERLIRYLKGETLEIAEEEACFSGWTLVLNDGYPLGFGKLNKGTLKNKYCSGWRLL